MGQTKGCHGFLIEVMLGDRRRNKFGAVKLSAMENIFCVLGLNKKKAS